MHFEKYHGLGNDFVLVDQAELPVGLPAAGEFARRVCDRNRGVGADGLIVALARPAGELPPMRVFNADGSVPQMCGNGLRCFAKWLVDRGLAATDTQLEIETDAGVRTCRVEPDGDVTIEMGVAVYERALVPMAGEGTTPETLTLAGRTVEIHGVSTGNPHGVIISADPQGDALALGGALTNHRIFPEGANIEFVRVRGDGALELVVWERGCGITQACGTGACATVASLAFRDPRWFGREVDVRLPGGALTIHVATDHAMTMRGPTTHVFEGRWLATPTA